MYFFPIVKRGIFSQQPQIVDEEILLKQVAEAIKYSTDSIPTPQKNPNKTKKDSVVTVLVRSKCQLSMIVLTEKLHTQMVQKKGDSVCLQPEAKHPIATDMLTWAIYPENSG